MIYFTVKTNKNNIEKTSWEVLLALLDKLQLCQSALNFVTTQTVYCKVFQLELGLFTSIITFKKLFSEF